MCDHLNSTVGIYTHDTLNVDVENDARKLMKCRINCTTETWMSLLMNINYLPLRTVIGPQMKS